MSRRWLTGRGVTALAMAASIAACGGDPDTDSGANPDSAAPGVITAVPSAGTQGSSSGPSAPGSGDDSSDDSDRDATAPTDAPVESAAVDDGWPAEACSNDGAPHELASLDGDRPAISLRTASLDSPLGDLTVRRINCGPEFVNLGNELPADRPLLIWLWAPH